MLGCKWIVRDQGVWGGLFLCYMLANKLVLLVKSALVFGAVACEFRVGFIFIGGVVIWAGYGVR